MLGRSIGDATDPWVTELKLWEIGDEGCAHLLLARFWRSRTRRVVERLLYGCPLPAVIIRIVLAYIGFSTDGSEGLNVDVTGNRISRLPRALAFLPHVHLNFNSRLLQYPPCELISGYDAAAQTASARRFLLSAFQSRVPPQCMSLVDSEDDGVQSEESGNHGAAASSKQTI